jgi:hypothetical protein
MRCDSDFGGFGFVDSPLLFSFDRDYATSSPYSMRMSCSTWLEGCSIIVATSCPFKTLGDVYIYHIERAYRTQMRLHSTQVQSGVADRPRSMWSRKSGLELWEDTRVGG